MERHMDPVNLFEFEEVARARMSQTDYDGVAGGATDELTLHRTRACFESILLRPRRLVDVSARDLATTVLGERIAFPVMLAPSGGHGVAHPDGELASARAAGAAGTVMVLSPGSTYLLEDVAEAATGPLWFQQYLFRDRGLTLSMAQRAEAAGYRALCITVDSFGLHKRERNLRSSQAGEVGHGGADVNYADYIRSLGPDAPNVTDLIDPGATWAELDWFMAQSPLPLVVKGILTGEDAALCVEHGVQALIVSNHGGRNLDTTLASIEALPEVAEAAAGRLEVYMDGGIRRGTDVLKALALGARAVLVGRPIFWGLAGGGEDGLRTVLGMLRDELDIAMALCGCPTVASIDGAVLGTAPVVATKGERR